MNLVLGSFKKDEYDLGVEIKNSFFQEQFGHLRTCHPRKKGQEYPAHGTLSKYLFAWALPVSPWFPQVCRWSRPLPVLRPHGGVQEDRLQVATAAA